MVSKKNVSFGNIMKSLKTKDYKPIYYLMGEESYYIDKISDYIEKNVLNDQEKEFNQTVFYGLDVDVSTIINTAKRYPMIADHQVIIVKEAQNVAKIEDLAYYLEKPLSSTILVICHQHGCLDRRKKLATQIEKIGVLFESKKVNDRDLSVFIENVVSQKGFTIDDRAVDLLAEYVGSDLNRLSRDLDKLIISLPSQQKRILVEHIEKNIGISKEYNNFELKNALIRKDVLKANQIITYFDENPKNNPIQVTLGTLFGFFANLMVAYYAPQKTEQDIVVQLGLKNSWQAKDYLASMRKYSGVKVMNIISMIRKADTQSKGLNNGGATNGDIMRDLIFYILH
jgi:DNA polymerase III subunit delta